MEKLQGVKKSFQKLPHIWGWWGVGQVLRPEGNFILTMSDFENELNAENDFQLIFEILNIDVYLILSIIL